jgi:hypothetical protein
MRREQPQGVQPCRQAWGEDHAWAQGMPQGQHRLPASGLTIAARLLRRSALSTKPKVEGTSTGFLGGSVTPCSAGGWTRMVTLAAAVNLPT